MAGQQGPHELPPVTDTIGSTGQVEEQAPQEQQPDVPQEAALDTGAIDELFQATRDSTQQTAERPRDEHGKFLPKEQATDNQPAQDTVAPTFDPAYLAEGKSLGFSDDELNAMPSDAVLRSAIAGRRAEYMQRFGQTQTVADQPFYGQQAPPPQQTPPQDEDPLGNLDLTINDDDLADEYAGPLKQTQQYVNKLKETFAAEMAQLRKTNAELQSVVQQSVSATQEAAKQQQVASIDNIAASIPGLVESIGKPSEAFNDRSKSTPQYVRWTALAGPVGARLEQFARENYYPTVDHIPLDTQRAILADTAKSLNLIGQPPNGRTANNGALPGQVVRQTGRQAAPPSSEPAMSGQAAGYEQSYSKISDIWDRGGGNPFDGRRFS